MIKFCLEGVEDDKDGADDVELDDGMPGWNQERWQLRAGLSWLMEASRTPLTLFQSSSHCRGIPYHLADG